MRVIAIIRHNTQLGGDLRLAVREFETLTGTPGLPIVDRRQMLNWLKNIRVASVPLLSSNKDVVALSWASLSIEATIRLIRQAAFVQEVIVEGEMHVLRALQQKCANYCVVLSELCGDTLIAVGWNYIVESEGVLDDQRRVGRIKRTVELLLAPYCSASDPGESLKLRSAKKTTLHLSHDLHIYKAKFFPRMIRALLNIFAKEGSFVIDPFCGSGTALLEASLLGHDSAGVDVDPICQLISQTKVAPFFRPSELFEGLRRFENALAASNPGRARLRLPVDLAAKIARRDKIDGTHFLDEVQDEVAVLHSALREASTNSPRQVVDVLSVLASDAVTKKIRYRFVGVGNGKYTIEIMKQRLLDRIFEKIERCYQLAYVFPELRDEIGVKFGDIQVDQGDARDSKTWPRKSADTLIITSPPYLPASSGREHYAASRALAFSMLGYEPGVHGYYDVGGVGNSDGFQLGRFSEAARLIKYLESDSVENADPQRDAMRFDRKARPTRYYLADMERFLQSARPFLGDNGLLLLVIAHHHTFYSHRRQEIEHVVSGNKLYSEIATGQGLRLDEEVEMKLFKAKVSKARPMAKNDYYESILVCRPNRNLEMGSRRMEKRRRVVAWPR